MELDKEFLKHLEFRKVIKSSDIEGLISESKSKQQSLDELIVNKKLMTETELNAVVAEFFGMPYAEIEMLDIDKSLLERFSISYLKKNNISLADLFH